MTLKKQCGFQPKLHFLSDFSPMWPWDPQHVLISTYSAICQESYWLKYLSLARHCCCILVSVLYSSVCLVYICTTNCKQSQTRTTVFWIGEEKKERLFWESPPLILSSWMLLFWPHFLEYMRSVCDGCSSGILKALYVTFPSLYLDSSLEGFNSLWYRLQGVP